MPLINNNQTKNSEHRFQKYSYSSRIEYKALEFIEKQSIFSVPDQILFDENKNCLSMENVRGGVLIKLLRDLRIKNENYWKLPKQSVDSIPGLFITKIIEDLEKLHRCFLKGIDIPTIGYCNYDYSGKLVETLELIFSLDKSFVSSSVLLSLKKIMLELEKESIVPFLDAATYNILVRDTHSIEDWILKLQGTDVFDFVEDVYPDLVYIDFETFNQLVSPFDDISLLLESTTAQKADLSQELLKVQRKIDYLIPALYRNLRNYVRHLKYLFDTPKIYFERYSHYGSIFEESPNWYLGRVKSNLLSLIDAGYQLHHVYEWTELVDKELHQKVDTKISMLDLKN